MLFLLRGLLLAVVTGRTHEQTHKLTTAIGANFGADFKKPGHAPFSGFKEENFLCDAEEGFIQKCVPKWQQECRRTYAHNKALQGKLCETHLDRNYVKIRTMIPQKTILEQWQWDKARRDYDVGWVRHEFPKFSKTGGHYLKFGEEGSLPAALHAKLKDWYARAGPQSQPEMSQPAFGYNCNTGHDNDDWVVVYNPLTESDTKAFAQLKEWIRKQLSKWLGEDVNENTAVYGAREYHRGSVCGMHTDAMQTHAFSAIYQLDQFGMDEPWGLDYVSCGLPL
jgi:hypothetical protein